MCKITKSQLKKLIDQKNADIDKNKCFSYTFLLYEQIFLKTS